MIPEFHSPTQFLIANIFCAILLIAVFISWHAFIDANRERVKAESRYNAQPRVKQLSSRLKWPARLLHFIQFGKRK